MKWLVSASIHESVEFQHLTPIYWLVTFQYFYLWMALTSVEKKNSSEAVQQKQQRNEFVAILKVSMK